MLAPLAQALLRHRAHPLTIDHQAGGGVGVKGIETENDGHLMVYEDQGVTALKVEWTPYLSMIDKPWSLFYATP